MACLDTSCLLDLSGRGGGRAMAAAERVVRSLMAAGEMLTTTRFSVAELLVGVERSSDQAYEEAAVERLLDRLLVLEFGEAAARTFARVKAELHRRGRPVPDMDVLIASVALTEKHSVITRNTKHFSVIPGLRVIAY